MLAKIPNQNYHKESDYKDLRKTNDLVIPQNNAQISNFLELKFTTIAKFITNLLIPVNVFRSYAIWSTGI